LDGSEFKLKKLKPEIKMSECYKNYFFLNDEIKETQFFDDKFLQTGNCLYDVLRIKNKIPLFLEKYLLRIKKTAQLAGVNLWFSDNEIVEKISKLIEINNVEEDSLKIVFNFENEYFGKKQNIFLAYLMQNNAPTLEQFKNGVETISLNIERQNPHAKIFNLKLRENTSKIIYEKNAYEIILLNKDGNITEGSRSNVFFIKNETVYTTVIDKVLPGITRENTIEICKQNNIQISETIIPYNNVNQYDAMFITGTSRKILPISKLDNFDFEVENKTLRKIQKLYDLLIEKYIQNHKKL